VSDEGKFRPFGIIDSLGLLDAILARNTELYHSSSRQDRRDAIANSLQAVASYLSENGVELRHLKPILHALESLIERENNRLDPIFCERKRVGKPARSLLQNQQDGAIAAIANHWLAHNVDPAAPMPNRLAAAARLMQNAGLGSVSAARIKQARELVSQEAADHAATGMSETVASWLSRATEEYGAARAVGIVLPFIAQSRVFGFDAESED
jgi:hypothetical protein